MGPSPNPTLHRPSNGDGDRGDLLPECCAADGSRQHDERFEGVPSALLGRGGGCLGRGDDLARWPGPPGLTLLEEGTDAFPLVRGAEGGVVESPLEVIVSPQIVRCTTTGGKRKEAMVSNGKS